MDYTLGFCFHLNPNNTKWNEYFTRWRMSNPDKSGITIYSICNYFYTEMKDDLSKIYNGNLPSLTELAESSQKLSKEKIENWDTLYSNFLQDNEFCYIALQGYSIKEKKQTCFSLINSYKTELNLSSIGLSITEYAEVLQKFFMQKEGYLSQNAPNNSVNYFLPLVGNVASNSILQNQETDEVNNITIKDDENIDLSAYKLDAKVKYFVVHSTGGKSSKKTIEEWKGKDGKAHAYIMDNGEIVNIIDFTKFAWATRTEDPDRPQAYYEAARGACIHIELNYAVTESPSQAQYNELAKIYYYFYKANNRKLIIVPHREFDRGVSGAHDDPTNFDFKKFYKILQNSYNIIIIEGTDGIEQSRYEKPNQGDNIHSFPPILSGPIKRKK